MKAPVTLTWTTQYETKRSLLSASRKLSLELIEEGIRADPYGRLRRRVNDEGRITDFSETNLLVTYEIASELEAHLIDFIDLETPTTLPR